MIQTHAQRPVSGASFNYLIFDFAPYYADSLLVDALINGEMVRLVPFVDYRPAFLFNQATAIVGQPVYGGIVFNDIGFSTTIRIDATPLNLGQATSQQRSLAYADPTTDPLSVLWEAIVGIDTTLPGSPTTKLAPIQTLPKVRESLNNLSITLDGGNAKVSHFGLDHHRGDLNNPHCDTPQALGMGQVPNWGVGTASDIVSGNVRDMFVTPAAVAGAVHDAIPNATTVMAGKAMLNLGDAAGNATNSTEVLTPSGILALVEDGWYDAVFSTIDHRLTAVQFSPFPIRYPAKWNGVRYFNFRELVDAVQITTKISPLIACAKTGTIYFPQEAAIPSNALVLQLF